MIVDGKHIAESIGDVLKRRIVQGRMHLKLGVLVARETPEIRQFVALKRKFGDTVGVTVDVIQLSSLEQSSQALLQHILSVIHDHDGVIVQLPLPAEFDRDSVLKLLPFTHDVDVIGDTSFAQHREGKLPFLPPVVGAMAEILDRQHLVLAGKKVVIVGNGRLVGQPAFHWAQRLGAMVSTVTNATDVEQLQEQTLSADVIILGAGVPGFLKPDMVKNGVVILDAGTSESNGVVRGDADPRCSEKASLFTPTPGGIGPITVAKVFENLLELHELKVARSRKNSYTLVQ